MSTFGQRSRITTAIADWMPTTDGPPPTSTVDYLIVAGGGYGSGGAGGMKSTVASTGGSVGTLQSVFSVVGGDLYTVTVGAGGAYAGTDSRVTKATDASIFLRVKGGGGNGTYYYNGSEVGGSGGGSGGYGYGSTNIYIAGQPGTSDQGYAGGGCLFNGPGNYAGTTGAGGGAGGVGGESNADGNNYVYIRGAGGAGRTNSITGTSITYAQGGGNGTSGGSRGNNTGDGGNNDQYGNSGIVVLRWSNEYRAALNTTGSPTYSMAGGYHIYQFTASGSITF